MRNLTLVNRAYCIRNPKHYKGFGPDCWGLTASYSTKGYAAHCPGDNDHGVITPTAALSSFPYTPEESMRALKYFYSKGDWIWASTDSTMPSPREVTGRCPAILPSTNAPLPR